MEYAIVFLPLIGSFVSGFFGKRLGGKFCQILTSSLVLISAILSFFIFYDVLTQDYSSNKLIFNWISSGSFHVNWSINIDPLTSVMLVVVSLISSIIHFYSIGYMDDDPHKARFMAYLSLFTFAMLTLVTADNFLQLYFGWEGVGLCSYLLIGFWYKKPSANAAAIKAFIVNRVGDFGFAIGIFLIFFFYGTVNYNEVFQQTPLLIQKQVIFLGIEFNLITLICLLLFVGAMGKSAQILLHTWLPDAMEGPTPVSALIHAATMVTAGVFLVVRCSPIFEYSQTALNVVATVGMTTAFFAATVALVQNDIKKISYKASRNNIRGKPILGNSVRLVEFEPELRSINSIITALIFEQSPSLSFDQIFKNVKKMSKKSKIKIIGQLINARQNRRHRPPRAFEMIGYTFDLLTNFGMFRDLHRHRALTLERQLLTTDHGFDTPNEIIELGIEKDFDDCMYLTKSVFQKMRHKFPEQSQYIVNFAYNYPYYMRFNLREATHLIELRTVPQGHADYRKVVQEMYRLINKKHPTLSKIMKYVDLNQYDLERFESEKRTEEKRKKIE